MRCDRCGKDIHVSTMSYFNTDTICVDCLGIEEQHPDYEKARQAEADQILKGNYNFKGIGLPDDLKRRIL